MVLFVTNSIILAKPPTTPKPRLATMLVGLPYNLLAVQQKFCTTFYGDNLNNSLDIERKETSL